MKKLMAGIFAGSAWAAGAVMTGAQAQLTEGGVAMQPAASALAEEVHFFHNWILLPIITVICILVLLLLLTVMLRYNSKANPTARKFSHNTLVEVIWTGVPILILLVIALPSFELLFKEDVTPDGKQVVARSDGQKVDFVFDNDFPDRRMVSRAAHLQVLIDDGSGQRILKHRDDYSVERWGERELVVKLKSPAPSGSSVIIRGGRSTQNVAGCAMAKRYIDACEKEVVLAPTMTLKVTGNQWNWNYAYPDFGDFDFYANIADEADTTPELYKLEVDNRVVVPVGETIRLAVTASDVIHAWALPAFAIKIDAVPGRNNETWFKAEREGVFYGQCSEICGIRHSFMPIAVEVVSRPEFEAWIDEQRALAGLDPMFATDAVKLAQADQE